MVKGEKTGFVCMCCVLCMCICECTLETKGIASFHLVRGIIGSISKALWVGEKNME